MSIVFTTQAYPLGLVLVPPCFNGQSSPCNGDNPMLLLWECFQTGRVFFIITEVCLLAGSVMNAHHTKYRAIFGENLPFCHTMRKGVFAAGATFVFLNCIVFELYYICLSDSEESFDPYDEEASIALIISK
ncbi:hypothetical protein HYC85_011710 [Camellia sinensis]|uniref:Uncharacterized protein n=1 Tax=Camellia sinensis TaxID=4442 RepID=A0A7J7HB01_CAMSI|nr:hypothetical protein HYC85_011710 [Camellia sinensis]